MSTATKTAVDGRSLPSQVRELRRIAAINLINSSEFVNGNYKLADVAQALGTCTITINKWRKMAETGSLSERKRGGRKSA